MNDSDVKVVDEGYVGELFPHVMQKELVSRVAQQREDGSEPEGEGWCVRLSRSCNLKVCQPEVPWPPESVCSSSSCKDFRKVKTGKAKVVRVTDRFANGC